MRELDRVVSDLPEDIGAFLVQVLLPAFGCPERDSNTLPMVGLTSSWMVAEGGSYGPDVGESFTCIAQQSAFGRIAISCALGRPP